MKRQGPQQCVLHTIGSVRNSGSNIYIYNCLYCRKYPWKNLTETNIISCLITAREDNWIAGDR